MKIVSWQKLKNLGVPMKWYWFLTNVALYASAVINLLIGFSALTGALHKDAAAAETRIGGLDTLYGVALIALAAFAVVARIMMADFRRDAPKTFMLMYILSVVIMMLYSVGINRLTGAGGNSIIILIVSAVVSLVFFGANLVYFSKRSNLFTK